MINSVLIVNDRNSVLIVNEKTTVLIVNEKTIEIQFFKNKNDYLKIN